MPTAPDAGVSLDIDVSVQDVETSRGIPDAMAPPVVFSWDRGVDPLGESTSTGCDCSTQESNSTRLFGFLFMFCVFTRLRIKR